ncbi:MAG: RluA family pseudouridine synthase [Myxococcota bacterium]|nr:RluA family pseudouridine synthase [Myxococcota bacterium]
MSELEPHACDGHQRLGYRTLVVPEHSHGLRLDRFLTTRFRTWSRTALSRGIKAGLVTDDQGRCLHAAKAVKEGQILHSAIPGLAPGTPPPPCPPIVYEDDDIIALHKPPGLLVHPVGDAFSWSVIALARRHWPEATLDLAHRIDRDTSGLLLLTKTKAANRHLKQAFRTGLVHKAYTAICRGMVPWFAKEIHAPIGPENGPLRVRQAVIAHGLPSHTRCEVRGVQDNLSYVECMIATGRNHQIRVHLAHVGFPILGDRLYGVDASVFLHSLSHGADAWVRERTGAPRHALHCHRLAFPRCDGQTVDLEIPLHHDMARWWLTPSSLPHDLP